MQLTKNFLFSIRKLGFSVTTITGLVINLTTEIALAGTAWQKREITRINIYICHAVDNFFCYSDLRRQTQK
ncbi:hypothetical protein [Okeania sp.]|uniref:hypothetical protein n=1 Tax=Okeania sp. TaxID=3100323 RepID=UPI002B4B26AB|nr:hypothetical protein [Okeania sp.]MEB3342845.1 hypothetical protein [Okeania sp.]